MNYLLLTSLLLQLSSAQFVFDFIIINVTTVGDCDIVAPECETYLNRFCLREREDPKSVDDSRCSLGYSEYFDPDGSSLPVSRQIMSDHSWPGGFQMFIRAYDSDPGVDDHLDNIFIEMDLAESSNFTTAQEFTGDMNRVSIRMTFRVMCRENYYGANCDRYCLAQNDSETGHYTCEADGSIRCLSGFENVNNNCRDVVNLCDPSPCANNGICTAMGPFNYICQCAPGYTGPTCEDEIDGCLSITCPNNSMCVNGSVCVCLPGFEFIGDILLCKPTAPLSNTGNQVQLGTSVIIGSVVGGAVVVLILALIIILIAVIVITAKQRSQSHQKLPAEGGLSTPYESHEQDKNTLKFEMTQRTPLEAKDSMTDNPAYSQVSLAHVPDHLKQKQNSMSNSTVSNTSANIAANPVYGADTSSPQSHRSTIRYVKNPVYGDPPGKNTDGNVYSSSSQLLSAQSTADNSTGELEYSYAIVGSSANCAVSKTSHDKNGSLQSAETLVEHEYAIVDKSKKSINVAASSHDQVAPPYQRLEHGQGIDEQSQTQTPVRLAEDEDLGYSALT